MKSKLFNKQSELIHQSKYAKILRPLLPVEAFYPDSGKLGILLINIVILVLGWTVASQLDRWSVYFLWLYLPLSIIMANSIIVLAFSSHDLLHGSVIHKPRLTHVIGLLGWTMLWMPPSLWKIVHNRIHHNHTNSLTDPDRGYLYQSPNSWGKRYCNWIFPSLTVHPLGLALGMITAWGKYSLRNLSSVLLFNGKSVDYVPASFSVKPKERLAIASELFFMIVIHLGILIYLQFDPLQLFLAYFLPMGLSSAGMFFYIHTNHFACQMTEINDPLINSISIKIPKFFDILHLNFSYHTESDG